MAIGDSAPLLFSLIVGLLLGLLTGRLLPTSGQKVRYVLGKGDDLLLALMVLAAFGLGAFFTYVFLY